MGLLEEGQLWLTSQRNAWLSVPVEYLRNFGEAMAGDAIEYATSALLEEVINFFPDSKRMVMQRILSASRKFSEAARKKLEAELNNGFESRVVSELDRLTGSSGTAQGSAE